MRRMPPSQLPRLGLELRRRPRVRTAIIIVVALTCGGVVAATVRRADGARAAWGEPTAVLVVTRDLAAGERVDSSNTRPAQLPAPLVPGGALGTLPEDGRLSAAVYDGEVLRAERLAPAGVSALAARLPRGTRAVAIPLEPGTAPTLEVGDHVDVLVALAPEAAGSGPPGFSLADDVLVVDVNDLAATVAVSRDAAARIGVAYGQGAVTLALVGT